MSRGYGYSAYYWSRSACHARVCGKAWTSNSGHFSGRGRCGVANRRNCYSLTRWTTARHKASVSEQRSSKHRRSCSSRWRKATLGTGSLTFWRKDFLTFSRGELRECLPLGVLIQMRPLILRGAGPRRLTSFAARVPLGVPAVGVVVEAALGAVVPGLAEAVQVEQDVVTTSGLHAPVAPAPRRATALGGAVRATARASAAGQKPVRHGVAPRPAFP